MSKAFKFSLQKVLDVRAVVEDKKAQELQRAQAETDREKQKLSEIELEKKRVTETPPADAEGGKISLSELSNRTAYMDQLTNQISMQNAEVQRSEAKANKEREAYIQASKDKMVLEKLKDSHLETYRKKSNQAEIKSDSELANRISQQGDKQ